MCAARTLGSEEHGLYAAEFDDLHDSAEIGRLLERLQRTHTRSRQIWGASMVRHVCGVRARVCGRKEEAMRC